MANEKIIKQKEEEVKKLAEKLKEAKVILLTDYRGINVADVTKLRTDLRNVNTEYKVIRRLLRTIKSYLQFLKEK